MNLSISRSDTCTKSEIYGVMWQVAPGSKIQLVIYELSPEYLLTLPTLEDIRAKYMHILCDSFCSVILPASFSVFVHIYAQVFVFYAFQLTIFSGFSSFGKSAIQWFSDPHLKHVFSLKLLHPVHSFVGLYELKEELNFLFPFICWLKNFLVGCNPTQWLHSEWESFVLSVALTEWSKLKNLFVRNVKIVIFNHQIFLFFSILLCG